MTEYRLDSTDVTMNANYSRAELDVEHRVVYLD